jgi:hypothetical protein
MLYKNIVCLSHDWWRVFMQIISFKGNGGTGKRVEAHLAIFKRKLFESKQLI